MARRSPRFFSKIYGQKLLQEGHEEIAEAVIRRALTLDSSNPVLKEAYRDVN